MIRASFLCLPLLIGLAAPAASATDLLQAWQAARQHAPEYAAARSATLAAQAQREQARALWLPTVVLEAGVGRMGSDSKTSGAQFAAPGFGQSTGVAFNTSIDNGTLERYTLSAKQPLFNRERLAQSRQLNLAADAADAEWQNANQSLMLRVGERYFDVLLASETVRMLRQQQTAVEHALAEAKDRFKLGNSPVTDTHEAGARFEAIRAQVMAAEIELQLKRTAFADLTGLTAQGLATLRSDAGPPAAHPAQLEVWIENASRFNPTLQAQAKGQSIAREESAKHGALAAPTLDLVAQLGRERLHGGGDFGNAENRADRQMMGVQLTIPIFTGGYRSARHEEALHLADKAQAEGERLRREIALQTRAAWLNLSLGAARIAALEQAHKASQARLDATRLGRSIGDRTTLELLNAENDATSTELALLQTRVSVALADLRLAALAGSLDINKLTSINDMLRSPTAN